VVVLVDFLGGDLAAEDAAEEATGCGIGHGVLSFYRTAGVVKCADFAGGGAGTLARCF
jgi:hypothetical protein